MLEIDKAVVDRIIADTSLISLMGITSADDRVYSWSPATDIIYTTSTIECAILYKNSNGKKPLKWSYPNQIPDFLYYFRILSINPLKLEQVRERLFVLFDESSLQTTNWNIKHTEIFNDILGDNEGSPTMPVYVRNMIFRFGVVVKRESE